MKANKVSNELYSCREVEKLRFLTLRVLLLQNKASKLGTIFWDTWYIRTFYQNSRIDFTVSKSRGKVKYEF